jgi:hypothetical protein
MTPREKLTLAMRLAELPRPPDCPELVYDSHTGPAVGLSSSLLWRIKSMLTRADEGESDPEEDTLAARKTLSLMLTAVDRPLPGWTASRTVRLLHSMWGSGERPQSLELACAQSSPAQQHTVHQTATPRQSDQAGPGFVIPRSRPAHAELRRGVDVISGACAGLESFAPAAIPASEAGYLIREIKNNQQILRRILKSIQEG